MATFAVAISQQDVAAFCIRNHVRKLSLFGSVLTDRFREESDVDMLVEFEAGHVPGLIELAGMEIEMCEIVGRKVDLRTAGELSPYIREKVMASAVLQYERRRP